MYLYFFFDKVKLRCYYSVTISDLQEELKIKQLSMQLIDTHFKFYYSKNNCD